MANGSSDSLTAFLSLANSLLPRVFGSERLLDGRWIQSGMVCPSHFRRWVRAAIFALIVDGFNSPRLFIHASIRPLLGSTNVWKGLTGMAEVSSQTKVPSPGREVVENALAATSYALMVWELFFSERNCCIQQSCHFSSPSLFNLDGSECSRPISSESNLWPNLPLSGFSIPFRSPSPVNPSRLQPRTACASLSRRT